MNNWPTFFEYSIFPFFLVVATSLIKILAKHSTRVKWTESLSIGLDIIMMSIFGSFIYGVSVHNHFSQHPATVGLLLNCVIFAGSLLVVSLALAVLMRFLWKDSPRKSCLIPNIVSVVCLVFLLVMVSDGNNRLGEQKVAPTATPPTNTPTPTPPTNTPTPTPHGQRKPK